MKRITFVIVLAALLIATTGAASAATSRIEFTGTTKCFDQESGTLIREWFPGINYQGREFAQVCRDKASIPQLNGIEYIDFKVQVVGTDGKWLMLSGTDRMETKEGGVWVGSFEWPANTWILKIVMHGEGIYAGQQLHMFEDASTDEFWGYIEVTGN